MIDNKEEEEKEPEYTATRELSMEVPRKELLHEPVAPFLSIYLKD